MKTIKPFLILLCIWSLATLVAYGQPCNFDIDSPDGTTITCNIPQVTLIADTNVTNPSTIITYIWTMAGSATPIGSDDSLTVSMPGKYFVEVTGELGGNIVCISTDSAIVSIDTMKPAPRITATAVDICMLQSTATLTASGGVSYIWSPGGSTNQSIVVSQGGTYTVTATGSNGCQAQISQPITARPLPPVSVSPPSVTICAGQTSATLTAVTSVTNFLWRPSMQTTRSISVSQAGTYTVEVTDAFGCTNQASSIVMSQPIPSVSISPTTASICPGQTTTTLTASSNAANPSYLWRPGFVTNPTITVGLAGTYTVEVTDALGCTNQTSATVSNYSLPTASIVSSAPLVTPTSTEVCPGSSITLTGTGGTSCRWIIGSNSSNCSISVNHAQAGQYRLEVTDSNSCTAQTDMFVIGLTAPPVSIVSTGTSICPNQTSVKLTATGAVTYRWLPNGPNTDTLIVSQAGTYIVEGEDAKGCTARDTIVISKFNVLPTAMVTSDVIGVCKGQTKALLTASGGDSYLWTPPMGVNINRMINPLVVDSPGIYTVTATASNGCKDDTSITIADFPLPTACIAPEIDTLCAGETTELNGSCSFGTGTLDYLWSKDNATQSSIIANAADTYALTVTDANQCTDQTTALVRSEGLPTLAFQGNEIICGSGSRSLNVILDGGPFSKVSYIWQRKNSSGTWEDAGSDSSTLLTGSLLRTTEYRVTVTTRCGSVTGIVEVPYITDIAPKIIGPDLVCRGQEAIYYIEEDPNLFGSSKIFWQIEGVEGGTILRHFADSAAVLIKWDDQSGTYELKVRQRIDLCSGRDSITVNIGSELAAESGSIRYYAFNNIFICTDRDRCYQWGYYDPSRNVSEPIPEETFQSYAAGNAYNSSFNYWVKIWDGDCSSSNSTCVNVSLFRFGDDTTLVGVEPSPAFRLYPNPNDGQFALEGEMLDGTYTLMIVDAKGRQVFEKNIQIQYGRLEEEIHIDFTSNGLHTLVLLNKNGYVKSQAFIILKK